VLHLRDALIVAKVGIHTASKQQKIRCLRFGIRFRTQVFHLRYGQDETPLPALFRDVISHRFIQRRSFAN
jgi:hypothetical protein